MTTKQQNKGKQGAGRNLSVEDVKVTAAERAELVARVEAARVSGRDAVIEAARVTHAVIVAGLIGPKDKGGEWATAGDYAKALGVSGGNLSGLKALGKALALGLEVGHPAFDAVYSQRQSLGKVAKTAKRLSEITAEAKRQAKTPRAVTSATEPTATGPAPSESQSVLDALTVIRDGIGSLSHADALIVANSLAGLLSDAQDRVKATKSTRKSA